MKIKLLIGCLLMMGYCFGQKETLRTTEIHAIQKHLQTFGTSDEKFFKLPVDESELRMFKMERIAPSLPTELQSKYPSIKSFQGKTLDGKGTIVVTSTATKFYGTVTTEKGVYQFFSKNNGSATALQIESAAMELQQCGDCESYRCAEDDDANIKSVLGSKQLTNTTMLAASGSRGAVKTTFQIVITATGLRNEDL